MGVSRMGRVEAGRSFVHRGPVSFCPHPQLAPEQCASGGGVLPFWSFSASFFLYIDAYCILRASQRTTGDPRGPCRRPSMTTRHLPPFLPLPLNMFRRHLLFFSSSGVVNFRVSRRPSPNLQTKALARTFPLLLIRMGPVQSTLARAWLC